MDFINDDEKMRDFFKLTKEEFLSSYSYLKEKDYEETKNIVEITKLSILKDLKQNIEHNILNYSANYLMTRPKEEYVNEWKAENKKLLLVEEMLKDEKQKKEKNKEIRGGNR